MIVNQTDSSLASKFSIKTLGERGFRPRCKYRKALDEVLKVTSTNRVFRTKEQALATLEQIKTGLSYFHPELNVQQDRIHTHPLNI